MTQAMTAPPDTAGAESTEATLRDLRARHTRTPDARTAYALGVALAEAGREEEAAGRYREALAFDRRLLEARVNLGNVLRVAGHLAEARHHHLLAYAQAPSHPLVIRNLAASMAASGWREEARHLMEKLADAGLAERILAALAGDEAESGGGRVGGYHVALAYSPGAALAWLGLGRACAADGAPELAWDAFAMACDLAPDRIEAWSELDTASRRIGRPQAAVEALERLQVLLPGNVQVLNNLGGLLLEARRHDEAIERLEEASRRAPADPMVLANLMAAYSGKTDHANALAAGLRLSEVGTPDAGLLSKLIVTGRHLFDWSRLAPLQEAFDRRRAAGDDSAHPFSLVAIPGADPGYQLACARAFARDRLPARTPARPPAKRGTGPLRIGYVSGEFREHATAWLMAEVVERHDRSRVHVTAFCTASDPEPGPTRLRLAAAFDDLVDLAGRSDDEAAAAIRNRDIDILLDLNGYTGTMRPGIFARRPAAVQVNYLGFPGTLGTDFMDYVIADGVVIPPELEAFYSEKVLRLPDCYQPNDRKRPLPPAPSRAEAGLPEDGIVFCSFNNAYKLTPDVFDIWCGLLRDVDGSVLWVLSGNTDANANLRREAKARGVDPDRLVFAGRTGLADHLARFRCADLFLDTFPCTAHTTASDALWCGVPVVTRLGETFASRVAASILHAAGLPQLVAHSADDYADIARRLATSPDELAALKAHLEDVRLTCPLFDSARYTRNLEDLYDAIRQPPP
jgi:predicted O-linked N-acetylglucosamine transferase (SPINDLY family)